MSTAVTSVATPLPDAGIDRARLIRRVNQLYHDHVRGRFDDDHEYRHRVEASFWERVARCTIPPPDRSRPDPMTVLDLGCGTGFVLQIMGGHLRKIDRLIGLDISPNTLIQARRNWHDIDTGPRSRPRLDVTVGDAASIPLGNGTVRLVTLNAALHHLPHPHATLREVDRLLEPGGYFALGFEPNRFFFEQPGLRELSRGLDHLYWYTSPGQNLRRLRQRLGLHVPTSHHWDDEVIAGVIRGVLSQEGLARANLSTNDILDCVDPHARGGGKAPGFDATNLLRHCFAGYEVIRIKWSDYLGQSIRKLPAMRRLADMTLGVFLPRRGSLFSWLIRKPSLTCAKGTT